MGEEVLNFDINYSGRINQFKPGSNIFTYLDSFMTFIDKYKLRILNSYATEKLLKNIEEILKVLLERLKIE